MGAFALLLALVLALGTGCQSAPPPPAATAQPVAGGTAVLGSISDVDSWNELLSHQTFAANLLRRIFLGLAEPQGGDDSPEAFGPVLAESWTPAVGGRALTFHLREARWSDGRPITAHDVRFTWKAQTAPEVPWASADSKAHIRDVEVVDDRTVTFHFDRAYPYQLADAVEGAILPEHVFGRVPFAEWATHDWSRDPIGSGPFLLDRHEPGHEIVLKKNPHYGRAGYPLLDRVVIRIVPDAANLTAQLLSGDVDYVEGLAPVDATRLGEQPAIELVPFDAPQYDFIGWNGSRPPFDDPLLRLAMTLAIDREGLVEELLYGLGRVSKGPLPSAWWGADRGLEAWPHDATEARRLLAERGYATVREPAPGQRVLEFELITNAGNRLREQAIVKIQEQLAQVGVRVHVLPLEMKALRQRASQGDYDAYLGGWAFHGKVELKSLFGSASMPPAGANVVFYRSPEVDRLLEAVDRAADWREMKPALHAIQAQIHEDQPYTFLYESRRVAAHQRRLAGVRIDHPGDSLARLEEFHLTRARPAASHK